MNDPSALTADAVEAIGKSQTSAELERIEVEYLGRKSGRVSRLLEGIGGLSADERAVLGKAVNEAKRTIEGALAARRSQLEATRLADLAETEAIYIITPGRCYRRDAPEATRLPYFSQVEGLAVDKGLTVGDMKGTLLFMIQSLYGRERKVRVRPSFFPFTEPSFEFDVSCGICGGMGCKSCRHKGWLEVGGCGMVHPQVLRNGGIDPSQWNGYAWGFGIERMAMLKHDVDDIRLFYESDRRFGEQF